MSNEISMDLFNKMLIDLENLKESFHEHETSFSKFIGASEQRDKRIDEKLDALLNKDEKQDGHNSAMAQLLSDHNDRLTAIESERKTEKEQYDKELKKQEKRTYILVGIGSIVATALPYIKSLF